MSERRACVRVVAASRIAQPNSFRTCCHSAHIKKAIMPKPAPSHFVVVDKSKFGGSAPPQEDDEAGEVWRPGEDGDDSDLD